MRTYSEHTPGKIRRFRQRVRRLARAALARVRRVLKRVRGGVMTRHLAEVSICAPAAPRRVTTEEAAPKLGLPAEHRGIAVQMPALASACAYGLLAPNFPNRISVSCFMRVLAEPYAPPPGKAGTSARRHT